MVAKIAPILQMTFSKRIYVILFSLCISLALHCGLEVCSSGLIDKIPVKVQLVIWLIVAAIVDAIWRHYVAIC